jgi:outer membrane biosynthesis protein TonB
MRGIALDARLAALLLPLLLTSCAHKKQAQVQPPLAPPIVDAPPSKPNNAPANLPPPVITEPNAQPAPSQPATTAQNQPPPKPEHRHHKAAKPAPSATEEAANNPPEVSAVGQLSSGEPADLRQQTSASIADTEHRLNQIKRKLSDQEQKTSAQIREFLKQAKAALASGDTDGAYTLALKAKVLLGELTQ